MRFTMVGLAALLGWSLLGGCRTHAAPTCRPACEDDDQLFFANCVAYGSGTCLAGNRMCCALASNCIGMLDDQLVVASATCMELVIDHCAPACDVTAAEGFQLCFDEGTSDCAPGDAECCRSSSDCLGSLGPSAYVTTTADGCCFGSDDCTGEDVCDPMTWDCHETTSGACGDGVVQSDEACDPGSNVVLDCLYGETSCTVCSELCQHVPGNTSFCGDGTIDSDHGETCDPPGTACSSLCERMLPDTCTDRRQNVDETDIDCGGPDCDPCLPDQTCLEDRDCTVLFPECASTAVCSIATGLGTCVEVFGCDDADRCTDDVCEPGEGCVFDPLDVDGDGDGPMDLGCGGDCDDNDRNASSLMSFDLGCDSSDPDFFVDNDCDGSLNEDC
jgi:hypothetical protein